MKQIKCNAVVLRYADYKEADRMLTLYSREYGRISASVRGIKKQNSKLRSGAELFALGEYVLAVNGTRYVVTGYTSLDTYYPIRESIERLWCASLACEMAEATATDQPDETMFDALVMLLSELAYNDRVPFMAVTDAFLQDFLSCQGIYPSVTGCVRCPGRGEYFSLHDGGLLCAGCAGEGSKRLSEGCIRALESAGETYAARLSFLAAMSGEVLGELFDTLVLQARYRMDRPFKTAGYLSKL